MFLGHTTSGMLLRNGGTYPQVHQKKAKKDQCEQKTHPVSEVTFSTTAMPAYLQLPGKPTMVNLNDLNDDC